jgi:hypothetical protein
LPCLALFVPSWFIWRLTRFFFGQTLQVRVRVDLIARTPVEQILDALILRPAYRVDGSRHQDFPDPAR